MAYRVPVLLTAFGVSLLTTSALAGGAGCVNCFRHVSTPPIYGAVSENVMVRAPRTIAHTVPGHYQTVAEKVMVSPPRKVWQVTRDAYGHKVGCWVVVPAQFALHHRKVMTYPPRVVHQTVPAVYATHQRTVLVKPASSGWQPIGGHKAYGPSYKASYGHGSVSYGHRYGYGGFGYGVSDASVAVGSFLGGAAGGFAAGVAVGADVY